MTTSDSTPSILVVCTANLCRSPLAEHILGNSLATVAPEWTVRSAGTMAEYGKPMYHLTREVLLSRGLAVPDDWQTSHLIPQIVTASDLVLVADARHRRIVTQLDPTAVKRTFLLLEFGALLQAAEPAHQDSGETAVGALIMAASRSRGRIPVGDYGLDDPMRHQRPAFESCADLLAHVAYHMARMLELSGSAQAQ